MRYWDEHMECMDRSTLQEIQLKRLVETVKRVYTSVPYYRRKMQELGIIPEDIKSLDDLKKLPFTTKQDLRDNYPYGLFAVPLSEIVRIHASSGTTGKPTVVGYTKHDIGIWSEVMARTLVAAGADKHSFVQIAYGYGLFTGGLGVHYGAERIGASVIPISSGNTRRQIQIMVDFGTTVLACTPSYALYLAETMEEMGIDKSQLKLKSGVFGAEPWSENMRKEIESKLNIKAYDIYGLSEIIGPGVSFECEYQCGMHINEDHFLPEIINPETGEVLGEGEYGELVFTTITKEGLPLIRYRTRDITALHYDRCKCGRTLVRMEKVIGRTDDMIIIRGVNVFPSQIESVLLEMGEVEPHYQLIVDRVNNLDVLEVLVEVSERMFSDEVKKLEQLEKKITKAIEETLGISVKVRLVEPKTIERSEGKAKRVIDKRKI
ncbi:phenylacetate-CoA ligase [Caldicellulosiruptor bescii]|jgi:phenylacetate-CoA ligase|uniref:Phenylacetate-coenzyme A ligase n=2 Tax=Caldicellulosiruptor bescii TaxID=31899 RepID=B9MJU4_CALBD|nr:phenylacetate--CoA ligase [Caldicellulosiruptor bescii]ACM60602.1 Phenylacetate--CoA ligase [Caldicellulosiruptor bescii DSM 6725]PBC88013.1 phenylacetate-CoA ligase [Caldicellulosiruptor bescii]PBC90945.1 phenylacetate-CoA ligase [Caldicellulosiruptor bescii]PBD03623.1 phenylacetate-CoA ligase [Caldicellulosiruptor bescii]PBD06743.1 phenylacetate-CoA ligase [Caldicellulosiruptor bescii]